MDPGTLPAMSSQEIVDACASGNHARLMQIIGDARTGALNSRWLGTICLFGDLDAARCLCARMNEGSVAIKPYHANLAFNSACMRGHAECARWVLAEFGRDMFTMVGIATSKAYQNGYVGIARWLGETFGPRAVQEEMRVLAMLACWKGRPCDLVWMVEHQKAAAPLSPKCGMPLSLIVGTCSGRIDPMCMRVCRWLAVRHNVLISWWMWTVRVRPLRAMGPAMAAARLS